MHLKLLMILLLKTTNISRDSRKYFKRNVQVYQCIYAMLFPKGFCRVDDYGVKSKVAFDIAYVGYKNEQENIHFIREMPIKQEATETSEVVEMCQPQSPPLSTPTLEAEKRNANHQKREKRSANVKLLLKL